MKKYLFFSATIPLFLFRINTTAFSQSFSSSNLPIMVINTSGQPIDTVNNNKYVVWMGLIDNGAGNRNNLSDPFNGYSGNVEIQLHGSSTLYLPKKSYGITTLDASKQKKNVSLFGFPIEHDWVLKGLYQDKTFLRDDLVFKMFIEMGHYSSKSKFFELVVDGDYRGVYQAEEKVKRDSNRVNISKLKITDISGDQLTGGYIISLDKFQPGDPGWYSQYISKLPDSANYFLYNYPNPDSMVKVQKDYIKNYFDTFEKVLKSSYYNSPDSGYSKYLDVPSFIDFFLINEIGRNVDGYRASTFFYKDRDSKGGKLYAGPAWDFNLAFDNAFYNGGDNPTDWQYKQTATKNFVSFWWPIFMSDDAFKNELKCRYKNLRKNVLNLNRIYSYIDSMAAYLDESQKRNFVRWPIMGQAVYPNPTPVPTSYAGEIGKIKSWFQNRLTWLDSNMPGACNVTAGIQETSVDNAITVYPNPFTSSTTFEIHLTESAYISLKITDLAGREVSTLLSEHKSPGEFQIVFDKMQTAPGIYFYQLKINNSTKAGKIIIQ